MAFDGHFWVLRNGEIIDFDFSKEYAICRRLWKCGKEKVYLPAPATTQRIMTAIQKKGISGSPDMTWDDIVECISRDYKPTFGYCFLNCIVEIHKRGGELVFGSFGWKKTDGSGIHYEYGGENYKAVADFLTK
jgi:hypothetical protein